MMGVHHQQTPFLGGGTALPPSNNSGGPIEAAHFQLDGADAGNFGNNTSILQQPFDIVHPSYSFTTPYKYPAVSGGGGMAFTGAQWKELERQTMIYKCMISSVPVPPHLLFPISTNFHVDSLYGGRYSRKGDSEPGRCKRTDGKKWRCSKEVAPLQKYCERHLHRGRPRSRKPVELNNKKTTKTTASQSHPLVPATKTDLTISTPYYKVKPTTNTNREAWETNYLANEDYSSYSFNEDYAVRQQALALNLFSYPEMDRFIEGDDLSPSLNLSMATAVRGGPLGEALQPPSPYNSISTPATPTAASAIAQLSQTIQWHL
ncbi:hypothetical protein C2S51_020236 [Perilla frutescens var. frutescens]|nr:hypothetical protein C2S51_020236 [Perilla frutescens var. frutescens]